MSARSPIAINPFYLLIPYLAVPAAFAAIAIDLFFLNGEMKKFLPASPERLLVYNLVFNLPHIVASLLLFADRDYISFYKPLLLAAVAGTGILTLGVWLLFGQTVAITLYLFVTVYHVLMQQLGINRGLLGVKLSSFIYLYFIPVILTAGIIYMDISMERQLPFAKAHMKEIWSGTLLIVLTGGLYMAHRSRTLIGKYYSIANVALMTGALIFYKTGYTFFVILAIRAVHDITAFMFYAIHDHNRNLETPRQILYSKLAFMGLPVWLLCPVIAILAALPLSLTLNSWGFYGIMLLGYMHYIIESRVWKAGTLHRKSVPIGVPA